MPELIKLLGAPDVHTSAVAVLGAIGPDAQAAPLTLKKLSKTAPPSENRESATEAAKRIGAR